MRPGQAARGGPGTRAARNRGYVAVGSLSSVSSGVVNGGGYRTVGSGPGIRAAVNARLEEVSFRTGMTAGAVTLLVLAAAVAAVVITVLPSQGSQVSRAVTAPVAASAPAAPATVQAVTPAPRPSASHRTRASSAPTAAAASAASNAQSSQYSPDAVAVARRNSAGGGFGARARGAGMPVRWPGPWGGSPRYGRSRGFTGSLGGPAPRGRFGPIGR
jgi:hypothetical protein